MSYTKKTWSTGDTITADALNNLESGASANASAIAEIEKELPSYVGADVPRKAAETITPGTANQTIAANQYLTGAQTIEGDGNLSAGNIKKGVSIFGVAGTLESGGTGTDTSDATATAGDILYGETAYVRGEKVTGTIKSVSAATITPGTENQTIASGQYLAGAQTIMGDSSLIPENIKKGISIFGVGGTAEMDTSDATAEAGDIVKGKTAYIASGKVTGTLRTSTRLSYAPTGSSSGEASVSERSYTPAVGSSYKKIRVEAPSVTSTSGKTVVDASNVEIGVEVDCYDFGNAVAANVLSGKTFTASPGLKVNGTMASKEAETITPGVDDQTIAAKQYLAGAQTIKGDSNLVAENIKSGVAIFGVTGTLETGTDTSDATATSADILSGKTAYVNGAKVTGTIASKAAETITPGTVDQTIASGQYLSGAQTIKGDANLIADNIKKGVSIFDVSGTLETGSTGTDTSDATATASDILNGKTAYVDGSKVTGTIKSKAAATITPGTSNQTIASGQYLAGVQTIEGDSNLVAANIKSGVSIFGVAGTLANSGGAVSESGTVTGNGGEQTIDTGLSSILAFLITSSNLPSATGLYYLVYMSNNLRATGLSKGQYFNSYYVTTDSSIASISGGSVTLKSSNDYYKPISNASYRWFAIGEA